jgi:hypothetical protein
MVHRMPLRLCCVPAAGVLLAAGPALAQTGGGYDLSWNRIAGGGGISSGAGFTLMGTIGQHDAGQMSGATFALAGGFWAGVGSSVPCYANCDRSTVQPILNVDDFTCFINEYAMAQSLPPAQQLVHYANCDLSTVAPVLNVDDFTCFINAYALGCP